MLDYKITDTLEELDVDLITLELWNFLKISKKAYDFQEERKIRLSAKERINEVGRLKEEVKNKQDGNETKLSEIFTHLEYEKHGIA